MNTFKIFVTHTPNKINKRIHNKCFEQIIAGGDFQTKPIPSGMMLDNTKDNISSLNKSYCELTTQYWAWKNTEYDYYGFCHYRRFFSFSEKQLPESEWGTVEYDTISEKAINELGLTDENIEKCMMGYDFQIAKGIQIKTLRAESVYEHYDNAPELYIKDYDCMMKIIAERYPYLQKYSEQYAKGNIYYPCNMFIMKKELFREYSAVLFDILAEFERRTDLSAYSVQSYRVTGHLAERILGIWFLYISDQKKYKTCERQIALFKDTTPDNYVGFEEGAVPIVLAANDFYTPILATCIKSIIMNASADRKYKLVVFHTDISHQHQNQMMQMAEGLKYFSIHFINISANVKGYTLNAREHITTETFYRFLIMDIMKEYSKVVYLDCDMIICGDVAELYDIDLKSNLIAAAKCPDFQGQLNMPASDQKRYAIEDMKMDDPYHYFQAGVLVINVTEMNKKISVRELLEIADKDMYRYSDQDILNVLCENRVTYIGQEWNLLFDCNHERVKNVITWAPMQLNLDYMEARNHPKIIHYAGFIKPWKDLQQDFGERFWEIARQTPFYEELLSRLFVRDGLYVSENRHTGGKKTKIWNALKKISCIGFPKGSRRREKLKRMIKKINPNAPVNF